MSIAGAYLTRRRYDRIELGLTPIPHVDRVEICDDAVFVSRFSEDEDGGTRFPSTARFGRDSLMYQMFYRDCNSILTSPYVRRMELSGDLSEDNFLAKLDTMDISVTPERWTEMMHANISGFMSISRAELAPVAMLKAYIITVIRWPRSCSQVATAIPSTQ
jgi:hypothetical protein